MSNRLKNFIKLLWPKYQKLILEYKVELKPRYSENPPRHLMEIITAREDVYKEWISHILRYVPVFHQIKTSDAEMNEGEPAWNNGFFPGLDIVSLYTMIAHLKPAKYIEVGSGNSTKVARKCIRDNNLNTKITSIDPFPRASIDHLADKVIRKPFESLTNYGFIVDELSEGDILFIDNSHRSLPNSDVTVFFMEILPLLKKGVVVHVHDVYLPFDYPQDMCDRFYSEQYLLATVLMANPMRYKTLFPCYYVSKNSGLSEKLNEIWIGAYSRKAERHGGSYWMQIG